MDLNRYQGLWYEIASYPASFSIGCVGTTATYTLQPDNRLGILNECKVRRFQGFEREARAVGRVADSETNAKLALTFEGNSFEEPYWIIDLDAENYQYAVVSNPQRSGLFILSRQPTLSSVAYEGILERLLAQDYDLSRLRITSQQRR
ncbi:MAG: lipocalin family protein [Synechococcaceae cyanobacterium SM2_3_1]|nr:lipocalin family protein [Synechococcaceae cyanobacterium SM2_3_1]